MIGAAHNPLPMTRADADLTQLAQVRRILLAARPDALIHTAAARDPDLCEANPEYAFQANVVATRNVVAVADELAIPLAHISTDAVFDGLAESPRTESDPTNPASVYGKTKLLAESAVMQLPRYWIFRVSVLFGPGKENFVDKGLHALRSGHAYSVAADQAGTAITGTATETVPPMDIPGLPPGKVRDISGRCSQRSEVSTLWTMVTYPRRYPCLPRCKTLPRV